ncbi:MAG: aromatic ring-hydroxylating dioxygenase subunit alpha [Novosphingobium sp.]|nr:aromatic ring-hydroxylating dioxygenase subunit alpha [Novosphingobium sp.]
MSGEHAAVPKLGAEPRGSYLYNTWYVAGWADGLGEAAQQRTFLEQPVALFRDEQGVAQAVSGRCPHRFAPLGHGQVVEGTLMCPYHGLRFDGAGRCVHNPHPGGQLPDALLRVYPLVERHALLWIWMGDAAAADQALIPDFSWLSDPRWEAVRGATLAEGPQDFYGMVQWHAPAVLYFDFRAGEPGTPREDCTLLPSLHAFTPETPDTTHYFWATARDYKLGDAEFSAAMRAALEFAFEQEDMPLIRDSHRLMRGQDFWNLRPLILGGDGGGVRARRMLQRLMEREKQQATTSQ